MKDHCGNCDQEWPCNCEDPWQICARCDGAVGDPVEDGGCTCDIDDGYADFAYDSWKDNQLERDLQ